MSFGTRIYCVRHDQRNMQGAGRRPFLNGGFSERVTPNELAELAERSGVVS